MRYKVINEIINLCYKLLILIVLKEWLLILVVYQVLLFCDISGLGPKNSAYILIWQNLLFIKDIGNKSSKLPIFLPLNNRCTKSAMPWALI